MTSGVRAIGMSEVSSLRFDLRGRVGLLITGGLG